MTKQIFTTLMILLLVNKGFSAAEPLHDIQDLPLKVRVAIIGGGISGLNILGELSSLREGEAKPKVGGRIETHYWADGSYAELGGQKINPEHTGMINLAKKHGLNLIEEVRQRPECLVEGVPNSRVIEALNKIREGLLTNGKEPTCTPRLCARSLSYSKRL